VRFTALDVQDFRNMPLASLRIGEGPLFILGGNGRGKTSILEALGLVSALRSFRCSDSRAMIRHGTRQARVICTLEQEREGGLSVDISLRSGGKAVSVDGNPLDRLADLMGRFPSVPLSSQDIQLLRAGPQCRRRFMDMMLAGAAPSFFDALRRYTRALKERNSLLRTGAGDAELSAFEQPLSCAAQELVGARATALAQLAPLLRETYASMAPSSEEPGLAYRPDLPGDSAEGFARSFAESRARDLARGSSCIGPHLDDFDLLIKGRPARDYASEGQQRGLVLALRLAQSRWLETRTGIVPVILADDIIGELDPVRRAAFWDCLDGGSQVIATGTEAPAGEGARKRFTIVPIETIIPPGAEGADQHPNP
jgi:DNA replication and repair protein RecF